MFHSKLKLQPDRLLENVTIKISIRSFSNIEQEFRLTDIYQQLGLYAVLFIDC